MSRGRAGGREERLPGIDHDPRQLLRHRRSLGRKTRAPRRRDRERTQLVLLDHGDGRRQRHDRGIDLPADGVDERRAGAAIGHVHERDAGLREQRDGEMAGRADA